MKLLKNINNPNDLKKLNIFELDILAKEVRDFLVENVSKTGGHLASNLGVVDLTIAMHYVLNSPSNKIIFDVGHQSYTHKILTDRKDLFSKLRQYNGLSGFPKSSESIHDAFNTGHSTTSISAGVGIAEANRLKGIKDKVYIVIGDGALTGGMAYEALNNAGRLKSNIVIMLNDNEMSISKNVGALSKNLSKVRINKDYIEAKDKTEKFLQGIPFGSRVAIDSISSMKKSLRKMVGDNFGSFFEDLGIRYYGLIDGHNINSIINAIETAESIEGPIVLHIKTKKGKGYILAENFPEKFHGVGKFDISTGKQDKKIGIGDDYSKAFGKKVLELAQKNDKIICITAAMAGGTGMNTFAEKLPKRFFDVGIAEQHAITFACGLAKEGFVPIVPIYSSFYQRAYDQIIHDVALQNLHVVFGIDRAGLVGEDGETHQGVFDISYFLSVPNIKIISPYCEEELNLAIEYSIEKQNSPIAIRYPKGLIPKETIYVATKEICPYEVFKGEKTCIVAVGNFMKIALEVNKKNSEIGVINPYILTAFDDIIDLVKKYTNIVVLEDGNKRNGFAATLLLKLVEKNVKFNNFRSFGYDTFIEQGSIDELQKYAGITAYDVYKEIENFG
ncbi:MAG: 1-deoxy-D-xylulose-5-phosphate synthase [Lachnospirales bacterium]